MNEVNIENHRQKGSGCVENARYAWLAPIGGLIASRIVTLMFDGVISTLQVPDSRGMLVFRLLLAILAFAGLVVFGIVKTIQCLKSRQYRSDGIKGAIACSMIVVIFGGALTIAILKGVSDSGTYYADNATAEELIRDYCADMQPLLPMQVDEVSEVVELHQGPANTLHIHFVIDDPNADRQTIQLIKRNVHQSIRDDPFFGSLQHKDAKVNFYYKNSDGLPLGDFEFTP